VPRALGVENYGNYNFLIGILTQVLLFLELRTSYCFFTKASQRPNEQKFQLFYNYCIYLIVIAFLIFVSITVFIPIKKIFFLNQINRYIYLASGIVCITWLNSILGQRLDAFGKTVWLEKIQITFKVVSSSVLLTLAYSKYLTFDSYFIFQYATQGILTIIFVLYLRKKHCFAFWGPIPYDLLRGYIKEFYQYCAPLFFYILIGLIYQAFDRWILQLYGGAYQQGLFSFSTSLTNMCALITAAMVPLLQREISIHAQSDDKKNMGILFNRQVKPIYVMTSFLSAFIFVESNNIVLFFGGTEYSGAGTILKIGSLIPLINSYANLHSTVFFGTSRTKTYLTMSMILTPIGILCTYVFLNNTVYGLNMGGTGIVLKEVFIGFISCIVYLFVNSKFLDLKIKSSFLYLLFIPTVFIIVCQLVNLMISVSLPNIILIPHLLLTGSIYSALIAGIVVAFPGIIGQKREILFQLTTKIIRLRTIKDKQLMS
jgi:O-antigen/teichoic acid export membrane protein